LKSKKGRAYVYNIFRTNNNKPTSEFKWENSQHFLNMKWQNIYIIPYKTTRDTSQQYFQHRLQHYNITIKSLL